MEVYNFNTTNWVFPNSIKQFEPIELVGQNSIETVFSM